MLVKRLPRSKLETRTFTVTSFENQSFINHFHRNGYTNLWHMDWTLWWSIPRKKVRRLVTVSWNRILRRVNRCLQTPWAPRWFGRQRGIRRRCYFPCSQRTPGSECCPVDNHHDFMSHDLGHIFVIGQIIKNQWPVMLLSTIYVITPAPCTGMKIDCKLTNSLQRSKATTKQNL